MMGINPILRAPNPRRIACPPGASSENPDSYSDDLGRVTSGARRLARVGSRPPSTKICRGTSWTDVAKHSLESLSHRGTGLRPSLSACASLLRFAFLGSRLLLPPGNDGPGSHRGRWVNVSVWINRPHLERVLPSTGPLVGLGTRPRLPIAPVELEFNGRVWL
jgi:hypothetical protein